MAILQISQIQVRRGLNQDLPQLASGELGWSIDTRQLYIGNGTLAEGAPSLGQTEVLTQFSILNFTTSFSSNIAILQGNVASLQANVTALQNTVPNEYSTFLNASSSGAIIGMSANNAVVSYTLYQGTKFRTGSIKTSRSSTNAVSYDEEYSETATPGTDISFTITGNTGYSTLNYSTTSATTLLYSIKSL
jgi:hypothetical protein